jgi:hypothetical protein
MQFLNHTPFPALAFGGLDQHEQSFHVVVLRQTLVFTDDGIRYADEQRPLCLQDEFFGEMNRSSVKQESDLCQFKPRCDVIVNATAYAPRARAMERFTVRLRAARAELSSAAESDQLQPLNPTMTVKNTRGAAADVQSVKLTALIDKSLEITGATTLQKDNFGLRAASTLIKMTTLGLLAESPWSMTQITPTTQVPIRYELSYGGECRLNATDPGAKNVQSTNRLSDVKKSLHPDAANNPVAHESFTPNPVGRGFARGWFLAATQIQEFPAPQIHWPGKPFTADHFWKVAAASQIDPEKSSFIPAGFGALHKAVPLRRRFTGTVDAAFIASDAPLPQDFDFAVWNAAPPDQQTDWWRGDEIIELTNLCAPGTPESTVDSAGNTVLRLTLPNHRCVLLARLRSGVMLETPMHIDTVIVTPDERMLTLVWRAVLAKTPDAPIRSLEARMRHAGDAPVMPAIGDLAAENSAAQEVDYAV